MSLDCVVIDRVSYDQMKLESDQFQTRTQQLERENELLRNELSLIKKLNDALENIKFNLDKLVQAVREQFSLAETPFDREITMWQSEYSNIKCMLTQLGLFNTDDSLPTMCTTVTNGTESTAELVLTADQIWTANAVANACAQQSTADGTGLDNDSYMCADEDLANSLVKSGDEGETLPDGQKSTKTRQQSKKSKGKSPIN